MPNVQREKYEEIIISHPGTDFDSIASMWAAHLLNPERPVVMIAGADTNVREFLALYGAEFPRLKLREIDIGAVKRLTVVDCSSRSQLNRIEGILDREDIYVELWDHHRKDGPEFKVDLLHYSSVGANTTLLVNELAHRNTELSPEEATLLLLGIYEDTGSLRFSSTTPDDLDAAAYLLRAGASLDIVDRFLGIRLNAGQKELLTNLSLNNRVIEVRGIPIHITQAIATEFIDEIAFLARKVQETENADVIFALIQLDDRVFIVGRSRLPTVDVGQILAVFGGGGHPQAASCLLTGTTNPIAVQRLLDTIREQVRPTTTARDIMSVHVRKVGSDVTIQDANNIIVQTGYSGLVVVDEENHVTGVITRLDIGKALHHGLGHAPVKGYMNRNPVTITEETGIREIQGIIIQMHVGFLPVVFAGKVSGVVTRTDVLDALHPATTEPGTRLEPSDELHPEEYGKGLLSRLPGDCLDILATAGELADSLGVSCYLVGGIVRDLVLEHDNVDIDLLVEGDGIEFAHGLSKELGGRVIENHRFRTAKVVRTEGQHIDVATARDEFYVRPGALPEVTAAGIRDDLVRRDFTINTLAIQLNTRDWGLMIDHFGGLDDIRNGLVRVLHTFSFFDDPTRILRGLRFSERYGFKLENQTQDLLKQALVEGRLDDISPERLRDECLLCLREGNPWAVLSRLCEEGVLGVIHEFVHPPATLRNHKNMLEPAYEWVASRLEDEELPAKELVYLAYVLSESDPSDAGAFIKKYKFDRTFLQMADAFAEYGSVRRVLAKPVEKASELAELVERIPVTFWIVLVTGCEETGPEKVNLDRYLRTLRGTSPEVGGDDLIREGYEPGPEFSRVLGEIRRAKMDGNLKSKSDELEFAREMLRGKGITPVA